MAIGLLTTLKLELAGSEDDFDDLPGPAASSIVTAADLEFGTTDQLDV